MKQPTKTFILHKSNLHTLILTNGEKYKVLDTLQVKVVNSETSILKDLLPLIFTLSGVLFGVLLTLIRDSYKLNKKFKETKKYFFYSLYMLKVAIEKQITSYDNFINELNAKNNLAPTFELNSGFSLRAIDVIPPEDLFKIFYEKKDKKNNASVFDLSNLLNSFEIIQSIVENSEKETQYVHEAIDSRLTKFNSLFNNVRDVIYELHQFEQTAETPLMNALINEISALGNKFQNWKDINKKDDKMITIYENVEHLILPLKEVVAKYSYFKILGPILDIEQTLLELDFNKKNFANKFTRDKKSLIDIKSHIFKLLKLNKKFLDNRIKEKDTELL